MENGAHSVKHSPPGSPHPMTPGNYNLRSECISTLFALGGLPLYEYNKDTSQEGSARLGITISISVDPDIDQSSGPKRPHDMSVYFQLKYSHVEFKKRLCPLSLYLYPHIACH